MTKKIMNIRAKKVFESLTIFTRVRSKMENFLISVMKLMKRSQEIQSIKTNMDVMYFWNCGCNQNLGSKVISTVKTSIFVKAFNMSTSAQVSMGRFNTLKVLNKNWQTTYTRHVMAAPVPTYSIFLNSTISRIIQSSFCSSDTMYFKLRASIITRYFKLMNWNSRTIKVAERNCLKKISAIEFFRKVYWKLKLDPFISG